jgi:hypothetical protein
VYEEKKRLAIALLVTMSDIARRAIIVTAQRSSPPMRREEAPTYEPRTK